MVLLSTGVWVCLINMYNKISVFENKNDSTYLVVKVENIAQKDFFFFTFNSRCILKDADKLLNKAWLAIYVSIISHLSLSFSLSVLVAKVSDLFNTSHLCKIHSSISPWKKQFNPEWPWVKTKQRIITLIWLTSLCKTFWSFFIILTTLAHHLVVY